METQKLQIVHYPAPVLRRRAQPIEAVDQSIAEVAERMLALMHEAPGVGLAAPQVGLPWRMFVANATGEASGDRVFINPELVEPSRQLESMEEGCLSLPDIRGSVRRPVGITIKALDVSGQPIELTSEGLEARIWQHEFDHLEGVLIIDRMPPIDRRAIQRQLRDLEKSAD